MTVEQVEEIFQQMHDLQAEINEAAQKRDASIRFFQNRILAAEKNFEDETKQLQQEITELTCLLEGYYDENPPKRKKSIPFSGGQMGKVKQSPIFSFDDGEQLSSGNKKLLEYVKGNAPDYLKIKESVDWDKFRKELVIDGDNVIFEGTGEIIDGLNYQLRPDKFIVKVN